MEKSLKDLAEKEKLTKVVLTIDSPAGPEDYKISKDADVTVLRTTTPDGRPVFGRKRAS